MLVAAGLLSGCGLSSPEPFSQLQEVSDESVVLLHGLARTELNMWQLKVRLEAQGYTVCSIDYDTIGKSVEDAQQQTTAQIDACITPSQTTHFVGHSLGGLMIRSYLHHHPSLTNSSDMGRVVTLGTPHYGSEVADEFDGGVLIEIAGGVSQSLVTSEEGLGQRLPEPDYALGAIAGLDSSIATDSLFEGENDGLVSLESSQVQGMQDFIAMDVSHTAMPYDESVAYQTMHFLQVGAFDHSKTNSEQWD